MRVAQVSDTHFGTERPDRVAALLGTLAQLQPAVIVLSGDVTQRARQPQFEAARRFVDAWPREAHRVVVPGNHDLPMFNVWRRFTAPYAAYERWLGPRESLWHDAGVALLALDATDPRRRKNGRLPTAHLQARLREARAACGADGLLLVVAHQPLWTAWGADQRQTLVGRHETARVLAEARADVVLSGHVHVPFIGTSVASDPQLAWRFVLCGAGTAVSRRTRPGAPNSFNLLELEPRAPTLALTRYDWVNGRFGVLETRCFARGAAGWDASECSPAPPTG
jgi:3',5'-cyclic AMP phosphodiesterase CpdA